MKLITRLSLVLVLSVAAGLPAQAEDVIRWRKDLEEAKQEAAQSGRLVLLHFYGSSCAPCAKLDKEVFSQKQTSDALEASYVPIKVNVDHSMAIASAYNVTSWPTDVVITPTGQIVAKFVSPQGIQPYLTRMDQIAVTTRDQAAAGMVNLGANGANPYSNIATTGGPAAATTLAAAANNNYAAPTQYQEPVAGQGGAYPPNGGQGMAAQGGSPYAPQGGTAYSAGASQDPYNAGNPYGNPNASAAAPNASVDRYANPAGVDRYAMPQYGDYGGASAPMGDRFATQPSNDAAGYGAGNGMNAGVAGGVAAGQAAGNYAPPAGPQVQQNPYAAPRQDPYANGANQFGTNPATSGGYDPNQRYDINPSYNSAVAGPQPSPGGAPQYGTDPRYGTPQQQAPVGSGFNPATNYSQAPPMNNGLSATAGPTLGAPAGDGAPTAPNVAAGAGLNGRPSVQQISGNPAFGLDGFCPVALAEKQRWVQGDKAWGAVHLGKTYLFISQEYQQKFLANPDAYAPVLAGNDPVLAIERNLQLPGSRSHGVFYREHVYLFSGEETLALFGKDPERYANGVRQAMQQRRPAADQRR